MMHDLCIHYGNFILNNYQTIIVINRPRGR